VSSCPKTIVACSPTQARVSTQVLACITDGHDFKVLYSRNAQISLIVITYESRNPLKT
jgi:hypothetical protein